MKHEYLVITFNTTRFFSDKDKAQKVFLNEMARFGGAGFLYSGAIELNGAVYYALCQSDSAPSEIKSSTGYVGDLWRKVGPQSLMFELGQEVTVNKSDVGK